MPKGHEHDPLYSISIRNIVSLFREKGDHYYILTRHNVFFVLFFFLIIIIIIFFPLQSYCSYYTKTLRKNAPKGAR